MRAAATREESACYAAVRLPNMRTSTYVTRGTAGIHFAAREPNGLDETSWAFRFDAEWVNKEA